MITAITAIVSISASIAWAPAWAAQASAETSVASAALGGHTGRGLTAPARGSAVGEFAQRPTEPVGHPGHVGPGHTGLRPSGELPERQPVAQDTWPRRRRRSSRSSIGLGHRRCCSRWSKPGHGSPGTRSGASRRAAMRTAPGDGLGDFLLAGGVALALAPGETEPGPLLREAELSVGADCCGVMGWPGRAPVRRSVGSSAWANSAVQIACSDRNCSARP
jgi:hypothetical protein